MSRLDPARRAVAEARLAFRGDREVEVPRARDIGLVHDRARMLRRKDRDAEAAAVWAAGESLQANLPPEAARAIWAERQSSRGSCSASAMPPPPTASPRRMARRSRASRGRKASSSPASSRSAA
jgi:hypothetical protein